MTIHFYIKYSSQYGQSLGLHMYSLDGGERHSATNVPLHYLNEDYWHGSFEPSEDQQKETLYYHYELYDGQGNSLTDQWPARPLHLRKFENEEVNIVDDWQDIPFFKQVFDSRAFTGVFDEHRVKGKDLPCKNPTHVFEVRTSYLPGNKQLCLLGSGKKLKDWDMSKPILLRRKKDLWSVKLNLSKEKFPLYYKFGVYNPATKEVEFLEDGNNRILYQPIEKERLTVLHQFANFPNFPWKAAGVNVQLSALKSAQSWGVGDFTDVNLLTDWAVATGLRMIQLLPINDTTAAHNRTDSYPYSAISAFALHPIFLNLQKLTVAAGLEIPEDVQDEIAHLNNLPTLDYERVMPIKAQFIKELYELDKYAFKDDFAYFDFFDLNRHWLVPYAAFCYLRDKYKTADFSQWPEHAVYDEDKIQELVSVGTAHYDLVAIHYFTQYHLHLQLRDAVDYAHKKDVILKGDLPIGVGRFSVDTWMNPTLFHMHMQAGAPPDAFATKGQNWSFPTYNWEKMQENNYTWWRQRMEHMSNYFDAIRIDHVLGFFRIWSIPLHAVEGILGRFEPALAMYDNDFYQAGIGFDETRFCDPYITDTVLYGLFGDQAQWVRENILDGNRFKEAFNTQQKVERYFATHANLPAVKQGLFDLLANVVLLRGEQGGAYHFRISMQTTSSFQNLSAHEQGLLNELYRQYFFEKQNDLWYQVAQNKLNAIQSSADMLVCAEDLGMVPEMVAGVLKSREMLALQVQRMPKAATDQFAHPQQAPYLSVVTPSTHDMSTVREWWEEDKQVTQLYYNQQLGQYGDAPFYCEPWINKDIVLQHLHSPAMWAVFLLQDLLAMDESLRREKPGDERINVPADPNHYWNYRMHITLEHLLKQKSFSKTIFDMVSGTGRR